MKAKLLALSSAALTGALALVSGGANAATFSSPNNSGGSIPTACVFQNYKAGVMTGNTTPLPTIFGTTQPGGKAATVDLICNCNGGLRISGANLSGGPNLPASATVDYSVAVVGGPVSFANSPNTTTSPAGTNGVAPASSGPDIVINDVGFTANLALNTTIKSNTSTPLPAGSYTSVINLTAFP